MTAPPTMSIRVNLRTRMPPQLPSATHETGAPILLEPYSRLEVIVPMEYLVTYWPSSQYALRDRRYRTMPWRCPKRCEAWYRLAEMFGYATSLRSSTQGRGLFTLELTITHQCLSGGRKTCWPDICRLCMFHKSQNGVLSIQSLLVCHN